MITLHFKFLNLSYVNDTTDRCYDITKSSLSGKGGRVPTECCLRGVGYWAGSQEASFSWFAAVTLDKALSPVGRQEVGPGLGGKGDSARVSPMPLGVPAAPGWGLRAGQEEIQASQSLSW